MESTVAPTPTTYDDELRQIIESAMEDDQKIIRIENLAGIIALTNPRKAIEALHMALRLARMTGQSSRFGPIYTKLGEAYRIIERYDVALRYLRLALKMASAMADMDLYLLYGRLAAVSRHNGNLAEAVQWNDYATNAAERCNYTVGMAIALGDRGEIYKCAGDLATSLGLYQQSLSLWKKTESDQGRAVIMNNLAGIYQCLGDINSSIHFLFQGLKHYRLSGYLGGECTVLGNIGNHYIRTGNYRLAMDYLEHSRRIAVEIGRSESEGYAILLIGEAHRLQGQLHRAFDQYSKALAILDSEHIDPQIRIDLWVEMGEAYTAMQQPVRGIEYTKKALLIAQQIGSPQAEYLVYEMLSRLYENLPDKDLALHYYKLFSEAKQNVADQNSRNAAQVLQARIAMERAEKERELYRMKSAQLEAEMEHKKNELVTMALHLTQKNEFVASLRRQITAFGNSASHCKTELVNEIIPKINENLNAEGEWETFEHQFHQVHPDFISVLSRRYPALSPTELKVCALMKTNLTTKQIASLLCTSLRTVEGHRQYIRRKLGLSRADNLYTYLASIGSIV